jgi:hypothetical protein
LELEQAWHGVTQGSPGCAGATLGFGTESRWDSCSEANGNASDTNGQQLAAGKAGLRRVVCPGSSTRPSCALGRFTRRLSRRNRMKAGGRRPGYNAPHTQPLLFPIWFGALRAPKPDWKKERESFVSLTQGGARPSLALGYFHIVSPGLRFGSPRSHFRRTSGLTGAAQMIFGMQSRRYRERPVQAES